MNSHAHAALLTHTPIAPFGAALAGERPVRRRRPGHFEFSRTRRACTGWSVPLDTPGGLTVACAQAVPALTCRCLHSPVSSPAITCRCLHSLVSSPALTCRCLHSLVSSPALTCRCLHSLVSSLALTCRCLRTSRGGRTIYHFPRPVALTVPARTRTRGAARALARVGSGVRHH